MEQSFSRPQGESAPAWRTRLGSWVTSARVERVLVGVIALNAVILGLQTEDRFSEGLQRGLAVADGLCLAIFLVELALKLIAFGRGFWRSGWNWFDFLVVVVALVPGSGPFAVLRALRVLRVLRLLTMIPSLRRVVAAFLHAIPGLGGVLAVMAIFFYVSGVLATELFSVSHPQWFGSLGASLYSLFQIMTLESWSMGIVRPVMEVHPWAWAFFVPFIIIATFTILNLFIGIILATLQALALPPDVDHPDPEVRTLLERIDADLRAVKSHLEKNPRS